MTAIATGRGLDVGQRLALRIGEIEAAVVATGALPGGSRMVHLRRIEGRKIGVTGVALGCRRNVIDWLAQGGAAVVAGGTIPGGRAVVIETDYRPAIGRGMAGVALGRRADMGQRLGQGIAGNIGAAVAVRALAVQSGMVHHGRRPGRETVDVTGVALGQGGNVQGRLGQCIGVDIGSAMAAGAFPGRSIMAHPGWCEGRKVGVAAIALRCGRDVIGRFSEGLAAVVTGRATAADWRTGRSVIKGCRRPGACRVVAGIALGRRADVRCRLGLGILADIAATVATGALAAQAGMVHR